VSGTDISTIVISGDNYDWDKNFPVLVEGLGIERGIVVSVVEQSFLGNDELHDHDVVIFGSGFQRMVADTEGPIAYANELSDEESRGLLAFVSSGGGLVGIHATGWAIEGEHLELVGGHAKLHPPMSDDMIEVRIVSRDHEITRTLDNFQVPDECYLSVWLEKVNVLAYTNWQGMSPPMAWTHNYGNGRVFYTTLGHGPGTFHNSVFRSLIANAVRWAANAS
jgi:type 1 glutamine amidotransferase